MADPADTETAAAWLNRQVLALAFALKPARLTETAALWPATLWRLARPGPAVPDARSLMARPEGYGGPVHDTSPDALYAGMRNGFHILSHAGPLKWWSEPRRAVVPVGEVHISKRFRRSMRSAGFTVTMDTAFDEVVGACAAPRGRLGLTWLYPKTRRLFTALHAEGRAHSVEVWDASGVLVGGVFGVAIGPVFSALSMFHTANDASKLAILSLYHHMAGWGFEVMDHQRMSPWVADLGGREISRQELLELLAKQGPPHAQPGPWRAQFTAAQTADWQPSAAP